MSTAQQVLVARIGWGVGRDANDHPLVVMPPVAKDHGHTITGKVANEFTVDKRADTASFVGIDGRTYMAAVADDPKATLTQRARPGYPRVVAARSRWHFVPARDPLPATETAFEGGFKPGLIDELTDIARDPYMAGTGLDGIRDLLSWFRTTGFAGLPPPNHVLVFGASETGRLIAQMRYEGFDPGEQDKLVFDNALSLVGAERLLRSDHGPLAE